jgi:hypothetical protein
MEEEVRSTKLEVGAETLVVVQNESTKTIVEQPEAHDLVQ